MTDTSPAPRVRPVVRRFAIAACVILFPLAAWSLWDYVELRRLIAEIEAIQATGEPVSERQTAGAPPSASDDATAGSYYLAGAALALPLHPYVAPVREWLAGPQPDRTQIAMLAGPLNGLLEHSQDALALADKAAGMPFVGFPPGTEFNYRTAGLWSLAHTIAARTLAESLAGRGDSAALSVISGIRIRRTLQQWRDGLDVPAVLSLSAPSAESLERLQNALEKEEDADAALHDVLADRARFIDTVWRRYYGTDPIAPRSYRLPLRSVGESVARPMFTHKVVRVLRVWREMVEAARVPWPGKARSSQSVLERYRAERGAPPGYFGPYVELSFPLASFAGAVNPGRLIADRASRVAVAIERFRRDRGSVPAALGDLVPSYLAAVPSDPYTGGPLLLRTSADRYTVYSVGPDGKDDGGDLTSELERVIKQKYGRRVIAGADVGVRVIRLQ